MRILIFVILLTTFACSKKNSEQNSADGVATQHENSSFEFYGNYIPIKEILIKDHLLNSIEIDTHDSVSGSFIQRIYLRFTDTKTDEYYVVKNTSFSGTKDNFLISTNDSILGNIEIRGKFFGIKGPSLDDIKDSKTIVFEGRFLSDGKTDTKIECTYFEGD